MYIHNYAICICTRPFLNDPGLELVVVMVLTPSVMNSVQFWTSACDLPPSISLSLSLSFSLSLLYALLSYRCMRTSTRLVCFTATGMPLLVHFRGSCTTSFA